MSGSPATGQFRAMIGALIWSPFTKKYLFLKRNAARGGKWESLTGRLEQGESFTDALHREVFEETGLAVQVDFILGTTHFYRGEEAVENEMLGVHFGCSITGPQIVQLSHEHTEYSWLSAVEADEFLPQDRLWLRECIRRAEELRTSISQEAIALNHLHGFEI